MHVDLVFLHTSISLFTSRTNNINYMSVSNFSSPTAQKRGPSTPLTPAKYNKRQYTQKTPNKTPKELLQIPASEYQRELLQCKYSLWLTQRKLEEEKEITKFLELEKDAMDPACPELPGSTG